MKFGVVLTVDMVLVAESAASRNTRALALAEKEA
jgi:hypothetical protein